MRVHHLNCGTFCPRSERLVNGTGSLLSSGHLSCHCLLLEAENGLVLVDTGLGTADLSAPEERIGPMWSALMRPRHDPGQSALNQIEAMGYYAEDVRHIVLTHLDFDHAGGLPDFPHAEVHVYGPEYQAARYPATATERFRYKAHHWSHRPRWVRYETKGDRWFGFDSVRALGDRETEILLIPLVGHTRGHCGVAVKAEEGWILHAGDAYFHRSEIERGDRAAPAITKLYERVMQIDRAQRVSNQTRLASLLERHGEEIRILNSHDPCEMPRPLSQEPVARGQRSPH